MDEKVLVTVGTSKGLFLFTGKGRKRWSMRGPFFHGKQVHHAVFDHRSNKLFAAANDVFFGSEIAWTSNLGKKWVSAESSPRFEVESGRKIENIWHIEPGPAGSPETLFAGVAPAALFLTDDGGKNWAEVGSLQAHPSRPRWQPGAGGLCLHSIQIDPADSQKMFIGISAVGVFRTNDGGRTWETKNKGVRAEFQPEKYPEFGQCVHKMLMAPGIPTLLYQQNHCGFYRSDDSGDTWDEVTEGLPSDFGFPMAIHPREPETIFAAPLEGANFRCPPEGKLQVHRSRDGGKSWEALSKGLPQRRAYMGIYRENMSTDQADPAGVYLGTNTGKVYFSADEGESWKVLADNLPPVTSVEATVL